jgi:two-component system NtrC family response regulator
MPGEFLSVKPPLTPNPQSPKLLIVDDDEDVRTQMKWALAQDYSVFLAGDRSSAMVLVAREEPAVVTLDLGLPPRPAEVEEGFATLSEILSADSHVKVIIITGRGEKEHALRAVGEGAYDFMYKPVEIDELKVVLKRAFYVSSLEREHRLLKKQFGGNSFEEMLGTSPRMQEVFATVRKVATTDAPVLIVGESGTGKELVARAIQRLSPRKNNPFVVINCGAIPETLLESELFGHEKGAFTGAHIQRKGRLEMAHGGTLFLDEIGELSLSLQVKLLRFLQERVIERVGGRGQIEVDARVLCATNRDLRQALKDGTFREDLYYRLGVVTISLPPVRQRGRDVILLANAFLHKYATESKRTVKGFTPSAILAIEKHPWLGNVREIENRIKRAVIMAEGQKIEPEDMELSSSAEGHESKGLREAREDLERKFIKMALDDNDGNISKAVEQLGISRPTFYKLMEKFGMEEKKK